MKVWIDFANSPHVLFFAPIIEDLQRLGHEVLLSARDYAQTVPLARAYGFDPHVMGRHAGRSWRRKFTTIISRSLELRSFAQKHEPDVAVGHGSYALGPAARSLGLRNIALMDYEHTPANHLSFRMASTVLLPSVIEPRTVRRYGATRRKTGFYDGFKEQVYLDSFTPDWSRVEDLLPAGEWDENVVVVARPPADFAVYHRFENPLFQPWIRSIGHDENVRVIVVPRTVEQRRQLESLELPSVVVLNRAVEGADLVYAADLVVSAGGTMNREAAVLGVPAYSMFAGNVGAVDLELERLGRLTFIQTPDDLARIRLEKVARKPRLENPNLRREITELICGTRSPMRVRPGTVAWDIPGSRKRDHRYADDA